MTWRGHDLRTRPISPTVIEGADDVALPFSVEALLDVRGRVVRLGPSVDTHPEAAMAIPSPVARLAG